MKIYLDVCCLNRLTDNQMQSRIRHEAEAVESILGLMRRGRMLWISSEALIDEIDRNPDNDRRLKNTELLALASETVEVNDAIAARASALETAGYGAYDALHLACAEAAYVDVLLTTDDRFIAKLHAGMVTYVFPFSIHYPGVKRISNEQH